jgi:hypothetical protein
LNVVGQRIPLYFGIDYIVPMGTRFNDGLDNFFQGINDAIAQKIGAVALPPRRVPHIGP